MPQQSKQELARQILSYLVRHPQAQDSVEGIVEWWLLEERIRTVSSEVEAVLKELVEREWVRAVLGPNHRVRYAIQNEKLHQIIEFIDQEKAD